MSTPNLDVNSDSGDCEVARRRRQGRLRLSVGALITCLVGVTLVAGAALPASADAEQLPDDASPAAGVSVDDEPAYSNQFEGSAADSSVGWRTDGVQEHVVPAGPSQLDGSACGDADGIVLPLPSEDLQSLDGTGSGCDWYRLVGSQYMVSGLRIVSFGEGTATLTWNLPSFQEPEEYRVNFTADLNGESLLPCPSEESDSCWLRSQPPLRDSRPGGRPRVHRDDQSRIWIHDG